MSPEPRIQTLPLSLSPHVYRKTMLRILLKFVQLTLGLNKQVKMISGSVELRSIYVNFNFGVTSIGIQC